MRLREILISEDDSGASVGATTSADIATVAYPLLVRGKTKKEKRKNARAAVGQSYNAGPVSVGTGVYENQAKIGKQALDYKRSNRYPDGEDIPESLPARYQPASFPGVPANQKCSNCGYYDAKTKKCSKFEGDPVVRPSYWCAKWEPVEEEINEASLATMRDFFAGNDQAKDPTKLSVMRDYFSKTRGPVTPSIQRILDKVRAQRPISHQEYTELKTWADKSRKTEGFDEAHVLDNQSVIYRLDKDNPMTDTEVLVIGGAGRYTLAGLRNKARREADQLAQDLQIEHGGAFRRSAANIKQLTNTLNTIVAAYNELKRIRQKGGRNSRGITDEDTNFIRECLSIASQWSVKYNSQGK